MMAKKGRRQEEMVNDLEEFQKIINEIPIDGRKSDGILLKRLRNGLQQGGNEAIKTAITHSVAMNLLAEKKIIDQLLTDGRLVTEEGTLVDAIKKDLLKIRDNTLKYLRILEKLDKAPKQKNESKSWIFDDEE